VVGGQDLVEDPPEPRDYMVGTLASGAGGAGVLLDQPGDPQVGEQAVGLVVDPGVQVAEVDLAQPPGW
jgi:hypothetical protein